MNGISKKRKTSENFRVCGGYLHIVGVKTDAPANVVKKVITKLVT